MPLNQLQFQGLVRLLSRRVFRERTRRNYCLDMAFYNEDTLVVKCAPDTDDAGTFTVRLIKCLLDEQTILSDGRPALLHLLNFLCDEEGPRLTEDLQEYLTALQPPATPPPADSATDEGQRDHRAGGVVSPTRLTLGRYRRIREIGRGGMGEVWLATQPLPDGTEREVALKTLFPGSPPNYRERFKRELRLIASLDHPHILKVYDFGDENGTLYLVMPYLRGGTLKDRLGQPMPLENVLRWLDPIGRALDYAHTARGGVIHRDVKPANILIHDQDETPYLADFGLARSQTDSADMTAEGRIVGTPLYMAPEQWLGQPVSRQTDLYALAIIAYEMLTGHPPFGANTEGREALRHAHLTAPLPDVSAYLTRPVLHVLRRAADKDPAVRYLTARAFLDDLQKAHLGDDPANLDVLIQRYLDYQTADIEQDMREYVTLSGWQTHLRAAPPPPPDPRPLPPLAATVKRYRPTLDAHHVPIGGDYHPDDKAERPTEPVADVLGRLKAVQRGVLLGEPGTGKSWTLARLTVDYADAWRSAPPDDRTALPLPVFIPLNQFKGATGFENFVRAAMQGLGAYLPRLTAEGRVLLLCDALNEMPRNGPDKRDLVAEVRGFLAKQPRFVVSCRVRDYQQDMDDLRPLEQIRLRELDLPTIYQIVLRRLGQTDGEALWRAMGGSPELSKFLEAVTEKGEAARFWDANADYKWYAYGSGQFEAWQAMHSGARLIPLCRNPFMLDKVCTLYAEGRQLPSNRAALFERFIDALIDREREQAEQRGQAWPETAFLSITETLEKIAAAMQAAKGTVLKRAAALEAAHHPDAAWRIDAAIAASLLAEDGENLRFTHQLIQEYFAVAPLREAMNNGESPARFFGQTWWKPGAWRETVVIFGEVLNDPQAVARWLAPVTPTVALDVLLRNGNGYTVADLTPDTRQMLIESANKYGVLPSPQTPLPQGARGLQTPPSPLGEGGRGGEVRKVKVLARAAAWRVIGVLKADPRPGVGLRPDGLPDIEWCDVPGGPFQMGSETSSWDDEKPIHTVDVAAFQIAKYPVTYWQFQAFIDAPDGYRNPDWWTGLHEKGLEQQRGGPGDQAFKFWNHPRDDVSWYEAVAFCRWLSRKLGYEVRLPTEAEWEKAARWNGQRSLEYPYGDTYDPTKSNTDDTGIGQTSAVGIFPDGAAPCGALDMSGNVWEWVSSKSDSGYPYRADDGREDLAGQVSRGLRGGSWNYYQDFARAAYRDWSRPDARSGFRGFRAVRAWPVSH